MSDDVKVYLVNVGTVIRRSDKSIRNYWRYMAYGCRDFGFRSKEMYYSSTLADAVAMAKAYVEDGDFDSYGVVSITYCNRIDIKDEGGVENLPVEEDDEELLRENVVYSAMNNGGIVRENFLDD